MDPNEDNGPDLAEKFAPTNNLPIGEDPNAIVRAPIFVGKREPANRSDKKPGEKNRTSKFNTGP